MEDEGVIECPFCGQEIVTEFDLQEGLSQDYVEDCPTCTRPCLVHVLVDRTGEIHVWVDARNDG